MEKPLCVNCKHFGMMAKCERKVKQSLIDGSWRTSKYLCEWERGFTSFLFGGCGPWGRHFKKK